MIIVCNAITLTFTPCAVLGAVYAGAGFANESPVPDWQQTPVSQYLSRAGLLGLLPPASVYHSQNRGMG